MFVRSARTGASQRRKIVAPADSATTAPTGNDSSSAATVPLQYQHQLCNDNDAAARGVRQGKTATDQQNSRSQQNGKAEDFLGLWRP